MGFRLVHKLSYLAFEKFSSFFWLGAPPYSEKNAKNFYHPYMTIHTPIESLCWVCSKYVAFKYVSSDTLPKNSKNRSWVIYF
jgi:hypothetical protein